MTSPLPNRWLPDLRPKRFLSVGLVATVVDAGLFLGLYRLGLPLLVANALALVTAAVVSYSGHRRFTLRGDPQDRWIGKLPVFVAVSSAAAAMDTAVLVAVGGWPAGLAKATAMTAAVLVRAIMHRRVLFRVVRRDQSSPGRTTEAPGSVRLTVVVPAYQEESRIAAAVNQIRAELSELDQAGDLEVVVVDDGSSDATAARARSAGADQVLSLPVNRGKGAAVRAGALEARGRTVAFTDADLSYPPHQLMGFVAAIESGYDVAIGNRHHAETQVTDRLSPVRSLGSRVVNMISSLVLLANYRDTQCGCKALRSDVVPYVLGAGHVDRFGFDIEMLFLVERAGLSLIELPVELVHSSTSTVRAFRDGLAILGDILGVRRRERRGGYQ